SRSVALRATARPLLSLAPNRVPGRSSARPAGRPRPTSGTGPKLRSSGLWAVSGIEGAASDFELAVREALVAIGVAGAGGVRVLHAHSGHAHVSLQAIVRGGARALLGAGAHHAAQAAAVLVGRAALGDGGGAEVIVVARRARAGESAALTGRSERATQA